MAGSAEQLNKRLNADDAAVAVIGLGYVGLPLLRAFHDAGLHVLGFDVDPEKVKALNDGKSYIQHVPPQDVAAMLDTGRFAATTDPARLARTDALLICVPTPLGQHREPDLRYVEQTADALAPHLRPAQLVVLESTTYPGTTRDVLAPRLASSGLVIGHDAFVAYSPEREDPGRRGQTTAAIPKVVGGLDKTSGDLAAALYRRAVRQVVQVENAEVAEASKLLENIYRAVNIALVNELKVLLTEMDIDVWRVIDAASTKPFGFQRFEPGPGLGGHCIPIDPFYLAWKAKEVGQPTRFIELAGEVNRAMPHYVVQRLILALNDDQKPLRNANILLLGLAYKPNVDDPRESPAFELIQQLRELGAHVDYHDPHIPTAPPMRQYGDVGLQSIAWNPDRLADYDALVILTAHDWYDWHSVADRARLIIDTRGVMRNLSPDPSANAARIVSA